MLFYLTHFIFTDLFSYITIEVFVAIGKTGPASTTSDFKIVFFLLEMADTHKKKL